MRCPTQRGVTLGWGGRQGGGGGSAFFSVFSSQGRVRGGGYRGVLDGVLVGRFSGGGLSVVTQASVAESAGSTPERVLESIRALDLAAFVF